MEGNTNWRPNQQGDSLVNNANDWRSQHAPDLRTKVLSVILQKLKGYFPKHNQNQINEHAAKFEDTVYAMAADKDDYMRKIAQKMMMLEQKSRDAQSTIVQSRSSVSGTNTSAAQVVNQGQSLPTSLPYSQTPTGQQWLPQNIQRNLNNPGSSGFPTQVPIPVSVDQNVNTQMGEGVHSNILPGSQRQMQPQNPSFMFQNQMDQQLLKEKIRHGNLRPPYMQQQAQPPQQQRLLKQPIQQQLPPQTSLSSIPQSSSLSSLPSSGQQNFIQQNSQFLPRHQFPTQRMAAPSQEQKQQGQEQPISQLSNGPVMEQNHLTSRQNNNGEQQGDLRVSSSQQNNSASFQAMAQQNMQQQRGQSGNFNVPGSSWLGTQCQELGQSQPMMLQQYQPQHPVQQQPQNDTQRFQAAGCLPQTQNIAEQQNQSYQLHRAPPANSSTSQDSTGKTVNASNGDWQEETYQKIKALKEMYFPLLCTMLQKFGDKLRQIDSLPQQKMLYEPTEKLRGAKSILEQVIVFLNVHRNSITEKHRDRFSIFEEHVLRLTKNQTRPGRPMQQQQQGQFPPPQLHQTMLQSQSPQLHVSQTLGNDQMNSRLMPNNQIGASSSISQTTMPHCLQTRPKMEPKDENKIMATLKQNPASNPQVLHSNISPVHHRQMQQQVPQRQQHQRQLQPNQQLQIPASNQTNKINDARMRQGINIKAGLLQQHLSSSQRQLPKPLAHIQHHSSPLPAAVNKTGTPSQSGGSPFVAPSPATSFAPSPIPGDPEKPISVESPVSKAQPPSSFGVATKEKPSLDFPAQEHPPFTLPPEPIAKRAIDRLVKAFQSSSPKSLAESVSEMSSVISLADRIAGSFHSGGGSRAGLAEDLSANFRLQEIHGEPNPTKRMKRAITILPLDIASQTDSYKQFSSLESEVDSTASSASKVNKIEPGYALRQEINEINGRLVETVVDICDECEVTLGTIVTCSYAPVAISATFKAHYMSGLVSQIEPLRLLVPANYPYSSPMLLEKIPFDASVHKYEDLSGRTRSMFSLSMKKLSEPMSLKEMAQTWNDCARATMAEYAERHGGGTFSSKYGTWETVVRAS